MMQRYLEMIHEEVYERANDPENGGLRLNALTGVLLDHLEEADVITGGQPAYYRHEAGNIAAEVHGYALDTDEDIISLFYCIDANMDSPLDGPMVVENVPKSEVDRAFRRLESFVKLARSGRIGDTDVSQPVSELIALIADPSEKRCDIDLHVLVTGSVSERAARAGQGAELSRQVWDILRLARTCSESEHDRLSIDFVEEYGKPLPCLITPMADDGVQVLLTCIPGHVLAEIYNTHRSKLLERNVRSFLQFTGKVNKGIRDTILNAPGRFLPYNNGLAATAAEADVEHLEGGLARVRAVRDFQIVNGGQTTASIASCVRRDGVELTEVSVAMKLTIVPQDRVDEIVPLISKHANTQNRIQEADFSANHPWHIQVEKLSRNTWTRPTKEAPRGTRWYYERSRGQYRDELGAQTTPAARKRFRAENPSPQKLTKPDLAKYLLTWDQRPEIVSRGGQKCFKAFMDQLVREKWRLPDVDDFQRMVALAILFRRTERLYGELGFQGYRANVVTYSLARLSYALGKHLPRQDIWTSQAPPEGIITPLKTIVRGVREVIVNSPGRSNVTEWCKRPECWSKVMELELQLDLPASSTTETGRAHPAEPQSNGDAARIDAVKAVPAEVWFAVSKWAKETSTLQPWQRSLAYSIGRIVGRGQSPSSKQAIQGRRLLCEARRVGFAHDSLDSDALERLEAIA